uniref:NADH-ubiquinone oxidoreductase chain 4 n=1 Tax=Novacerus sp. FZ-2019 TaxID=2585224 RepID=A0A6H0EVX7_9HEXA|nr:NADH dehydrogenase subunit 4 [Novacerus sp. FZ-2019]
MMKFMFFVVLTSMGCFFYKKQYLYISSYVLICGGVVCMSMLFIGPLVKLKGFYFGLDSLSLSLLFLSFWLTSLMLQSSWVVYYMKESLSLFIFMVLILLLMLILSFSTMNLMLFYIYFESSLIPTLLIITGWGLQPERLQAGVYFLFYTLLASLPLLMMILYIYSIKKTFFFPHLIFLIKGKGLLSYFIIMTMIMAFLVKMPMFLVHLWLPKAHVEAPVAGSMILAGVLLKLGGFGVFRMMKLSFPAMLKFSPYLVGLSIMGLLYIGLICCRMNDLKMLVAYSSVAHMGLVVCGLFSYFIWGYNGGLAMMVSHGLSSSGLFCLVNMFYERTGSRSMYINKGLLLMMPSFTFLSFMLIIANFSAPPTINLFSEIMLMGSIMGYDKLMMLIFPVGSFMGAVFSIFMFSYSQHGKTYYSVYSYMLGTFREINILMMHIIPLNLMILSIDFFLMVL